MSVESVIAECREWTLDPEFRRLRELREESPPRRLIGLFPVYTPEEVVLACGLVPVHLYGAGGLVEEAGDIDMLVNNAGLTRDGLIVRMSDEDWRTVIDTNLGGVFATCRAAARGMMRRRAGAIINLSSVVGVHGNPGQTNYAASKAGIIGFTKALARELATRNVRANVIAPGYIQTALTEVLPEDVREALLGATPLARLGSPEDVAGAVRFLCSDEASFITGEVLLVDGGLGM